METPTEPIPSSHRRSVIVCSIRKEPILSCSSPKKPFSSSIEPQVPWSPNSSTTGNANSPQEKLIDLITSSSTAHLLSPLFSSTVQDISLPEDTDMENLVDVKDSCNKKIRQFDSFIRLHAIDKLEPNDIIMHYNGWMEELSKLTNDLVDSVENMLYKFFTSIDQAEQNTWKEVVKKREESYFTFRRALSKAYDTNSSSSAPTTPAVPAPGGGGGAHAQKARAAQVEIEIDSSIIEIEGESLSSEYNKFTDWGKAEDHEIEIAMNKIEEWKKKMAKIKEKGQAVERNTKAYALDTTKLAASKALISTLISELEMAIENIEFEDNSRCLYSLNKSKPADVKYPKFKGTALEDFSKFEKELKKAFVSNRVRRDNQVSKLRACLEGHPWKLIPSSLENIDEALSILKSCYGDASRVMKAKQNSIANMGKMPRKDLNGSQLQAQVEWLIKLEIHLQDTFEMGAKSANMERAAFNPHMIGVITGLFPFEIQRELARLKTEDSKDHLEGILDYIADLRSERQSMMNALGITEDTESKKPKGSWGSTNFQSAAVAYKQPQRDDDCRLL